MTQQYEVNFFKPHSEHAKANKRVIIILAVIWAVAVFGFQALLLVLNKPTPEKSYTTFQSVWPQVVEDEAATLEMKQNFARSLLSVIGKNAVVKAPHKVVLSEALSWTVLSMQPKDSVLIFQEKPRQEAFDIAISSIGLENSGFDKLMANQIPFSIVKVEGTEISPECKEAIPAIMERYLVHNRNALTDTKFIGFPFHYWYTAQFLLIMFVVLCLIYAVITDRMNKKYDFVEEE
ncbi:DUF4212 domain-containing protein [bacterium]|nr:DUF4212 domain-containing protein [bacterium]